MEIKEKYKRLWGFVVCYFGDGYDGKTDKDIVNEALSENSPEYNKEIHQDILKFIDDKNFSLAEKHDFLDSCNRYFETKNEIIDWLNLISDLLDVKKQTLV